MDKHFDVVVVGSGISGLTAGLTTARLGWKTIIVTGPVLGGNLLSIDLIEGFPGYPDGIAGYDLLPSIQEQASKEGSNFVMAEVSNVRDQENSWIVETGEGELITTTLIIATGCNFKSLDIPGEKLFWGKGVSHCASCDGPILRDKTIFVAGAGDSGLQEGLALAKNSAVVNIITKAQEMTGQRVFQERAKIHPKINVWFNSEIEKIIGQDAVQAVSIINNLGEKVTEPADAVFVYPGLKPNSSVFAGLITLDKRGHIVVDEKLRSNLRGIFAAGTVRSNAVGRAAASAGDGSLAAISAHCYLNAEK
ncbi:MAG: FAD-dependent oxidoreductase [Pseudomonadota bacterium]|nr:FAD-dependent oxidoreductase [Pseudomonadota bacterium]